MPARNTCKCARSCHLACEIGRSIDVAGIHRFLELAALFVQCVSHVGSKTGANKPSQHLATHCGRSTNATQ